MNILTTIKNRFSCRSFQPKPVEEAKLRKILQAAHWAPSAHNLQDWRFLIIKSQKKKRKLVKICTGQSFIAQAPVVIVACSDYSVLAPHYNREDQKKYGYLNSALATENLMLAATSLGLATCCIGAYDQDQLIKFLDLPQGWQSIMVLPLGYPAEEAPTKSRINLKEVVRVIR